MSDKKHGNMLIDLFIEEIKEVGNDFYAMIHSLGNSREMEIAKLKLEECVMWAVKGICNND